MKKSIALSAIYAVGAMAQLDPALFVPCDTDGDVQGTNAHFIEVLATAMENDGDTGFKVSQILHGHGHADPPEPTTAPVDAEPTLAPTDPPVNEPAPAPGGDGGVPRLLQSEIDENIEKLATVSQFLGCNANGFDILVDPDHIYIFEFNDALNLEKCNDDNSACNCYRASCGVFAAEGHSHGDGDGHDHGGNGEAPRRFLDGEDGDGDGHNHGHGNTEFIYQRLEEYAPMHKIVYKHYLTACNEVTEDSEAHHMCDTTELLVGFESQVLGCPQTDEIFLEAFENFEPVAEIHPDGPHSHGEGEEEDEPNARLLDEETEDDDEHMHDGEFFFVGCNDTHYDLLHDQHIYTYKLNSFSEGTCVGGGGNCYVSVCRNASEVAASVGGGHSHGEDDAGGHNHGRRLQGLTLFRSLKKDEDGHNHGGEDEGEPGVPNLEGVDLSINEEFYKENYVVAIGHVEACCGTFDLTNAETHHLCSLDSQFLLIEEESSSPPIEDEDSSSSITVYIAIGAVCVVGFILIAVAVFAPSGSKKPETPAGIDVVDLTEEKAVIEETPVKEAPVEVEMDGEKAVDEVKASV